jgi:HEAT repeat protein
MQNNSLHSSRSMNHWKLEEKIKALKSSNLEEVENTIRELGKSADRRAVPILMNMLSEEKDINLKNALALSLSDLKADEAVPLLMKLIKDPEHENKRGSFVYALQNLDCREYFFDFVEMICTGNYEVYCHAYDIFESIVDDANFSKKLEAKEALENQRQIELAKPPSNHPKYDRVHFINDALKILEE